ncbi:hypothetical protein HK102_005069, partial [Quaeritorhiza haematococci]
MEVKRGPGRSRGLGSSKEKLSNKNSNGNSNIDKGKQANGGQIRPKAGPNLALRRGKTVLEEQEDANEQPDNVMDMDDVDQSVPANSSESGNGSNDNDDNDNNDEEESQMDAESEDDGKAGKSVKDKDVTLDAEIDESEVEIVYAEKVLDSKIENGQKLYLVKWADVTDEPDEWLPIEEVDDDLIDEYEASLRPTSKSLTNGADPNGQDQDLSEDEFELQDLFEDDDKEFPVFNKRRRRSSRHKRLVDDDDSSDPEFTPGKGLGGGARRGKRRASVPASAHHLDESEEEEENDEDHDDDESESEKPTRKKRRTSGKGKAVAVSPSPSNDIDGNDDIDGLDNDAEPTGSNASKKRKSRASTGTSGTTRKRSTTGRTRTPRRTSTSSTPKKPKRTTTTSKTTTKRTTGKISKKAANQTKAEVEERAQQRLGKPFPPDLLPEPSQPANTNSNPTPDTSCCVICSSRTITHAARLRNTPLLLTCLRTTSSIASWTWGVRPEIFHENALYYAIINDDLEMVRLILNRDPKWGAHVVPQKRHYSSAESGGTGYVGRQTFSHRTRKLNEARGNRQGNHAFYKFNADLTFSDPFDVQKKAGDAQASKNRFSRSARRFTNPSSGLETIPLALLWALRSVPDVPGGAASAAAESAAVAVEEGNNEANSGGSASSGSTPSHDEAGGEG